MQKKAKCIIGQDYPFPMLDEHKEKDACIARLKNAYALGLHGDAEEVLDGSAKETLEKKHIETGAMDVKSEKEKKDEKGKKKREREGNQSLDGHFMKKVKAEEEGGKRSKDDVQENDEEESGKERKETVQGDREMGKKEDKAEQGDAKAKRRGEEE